MLAAVLVSGCAGPENKLGRGFSNVGELTRGGELHRSIEQTGLFQSPDEGATTGFIRGFNKSMSRVGIGLYEIVTFPLPPYGPVATGYLTPTPSYPDSYKPGLVEDSIFATDSRVGFSGGEIAPFIPGSRFKVFDN